VQGGELGSRERRLRQSVSSWMVSGAVVARTCCREHRVTGPDANRRCPITDGSLARACGRQHGPLSRPHCHGLCPMIQISRAAVLQPWPMADFGAFVRLRRGHCCPDSCRCRWAESKTDLDLWFTGCAYACRCGDPPEAHGGTGNRRLCVRLAGHRLTGASCPRFTPALFGFRHPSLVAVWTTELAQALRSPRDIPQFNTKTYARSYEIPGQARFSAGIQL